MHLHERRLSASTVYLIFSGASSLFFATIVTVNLVYQVEIAKLNPLQLVLVGTALEAVCFLCQVPTGILADVYSRRLSVIVGICLVGLGFIIEGSFPNFVVIMIAQSLFGIGATFTDGAEQAWITDEVGENNVGPILMRSSQFGLLGGLFGALLAVGLASIRLNLPIIVGGVLDVLLGVFLLFFMPENGFRPTPKEERQSWRSLCTTFVEGIRLVRLRPMLITILSIELFYGLSSEGFDRLSTAHFLTNFAFPSLWHLRPVVWFGVFSVTGTILSLGATEFFRRRVDTNNQQIAIRALFVINALSIVSVLVFGLAGNFFVALAVYLTYGMLRSVNRPIYTTWLTQQADAKVRATVISMNGQMNALGQVAGGPPVGYIGTVLSLRAAMITVGVILSAVLLLLTYAFRKVKATTLPVGEMSVESAETPELV
jgi:DHA3 family tetracycline resistance protein-like MFS transporter